MNKAESHYSSITRARSKFEAFNKETNEVRLFHLQEFRDIFNKYYVNPSLVKRTIDELTRKMVSFTFRDLKKISKQVNWRRLPIVNPLKTWNTL
jgi:hypothetical protein